ncbi:response regulator [Indioceanicola profundi]|uniref:response regulator n=1 Tax=Indioceanicola profundi TaxID=2220096 RepID=UPI0013C42F04|nr:response regulator [Indioceanicola profundi]
MAEYDLRQVQVFLIDRESNMRRLLRSILTRMGMEKVQEFPDVAAAMAAFASSTPDLIIVDGDPPEGEGFRFVQQFRHAMNIANPFATVVATTWQATSQFMFRFTASGADDIILKPFSAKQVQDRVAKLVEHRRPFVVTSDYIGPDRRRSPREGQQIPLVEVPDTLRLKALGQLDRGAIGEQIGAAMHAVNHQKVVRHGFQTAFLTLFALPGLMSEPPERMAVDHALRIMPVVEDLMRRLPMGEMRMKADLFARVLVNAVETFRQDTQHSIADPLTLKRAALGLAALTAQRGDQSVLEQEVMAAVNSYRNRLAEMVQAKAQASQPTGADPAGPIMDEQEEPPPREG